MTTSFPLAKKCVKCGAVKLLELFYTTNRGNSLDSSCKSCRVAAAKARQLLDPDRHRTDASLRSAEYRKRHPDKTRTATKRWQQRNKEHIWEQKILSCYGMTRAQYEAKLFEQGGGCAICGSKIPAGNSPYFRADHNHKTGKNRGLLCQPCNAGLGMFSDDSSRLKKAAEYLERYST